MEIKITLQLKDENKTMNCEIQTTDEEFAKAKVKGEVTRAKGLGALSEQQAKNSMFGENQRMDVLEPNEEAIYLLEDLMGKDVEPRTEFIFKNVDFSEIRE